MLLKAVSCAIVRRVVTLSESSAPTTNILTELNKMEFLRLYYVFRSLAYRRLLSYTLTILAVLSKKNQTPTSTPVITMATTTAHVTAMTTRFRTEKDFLRPASG